MNTHTATCHTDGCGNAGHGIGIDAPLWDDAGERVGVDPDPFVVCGACGHTITDVRAVS